MKNSKHIIALTEEIMHDIENISPYILTAETNAHASDQSAITAELTDMMMSLLGMNDMAYIRHNAPSEEAGYTVFAADGTPLATFTSEESALRSAYKHNLCPVAVH